MEDPQKPVNLYNPDLDNYTFVRRDGEDQPITFVLKGMKITTLPKWAADQGANELAEKLVWERGIKTNYEDEKKAILKEIYVDLSN